MPEFSEIKKEFTSREVLERELNLKQLQLNGLLNITQAINNNISAEELFDMYKSFLGWEIGISRMALYIKEENRWVCSSQIGLNREECRIMPGNQFDLYKRLKLIEDSEDTFLSTFDVIIPVHHKENPIAYVLIGNFGDEDDMYHKVQFITAITNIIAVAIENKRLFKRQLEQERLRRELELAGEMQRMLIPSTLPVTSRYELDCIYKPHYGVGGDYFDFLSFGDDKIVFCIGDISGKGIAAALLMANFQANFHTLIKKQEKLDNFIRDLNHSVNLITAGDKFITFFIAEFDFKTRILSYVNAGHNRPISCSEGKLEFLDKGCTILGSFQDIESIEVGKVTLNSSAMIFAFTDGLTDLKNENGEPLSNEFLYDYLKENFQLEAKAFNKKLMENIELYKGNTIYPDDFTVLSCKII
jgi:phosphoserine phosphatase RsbU/P